MSDTMEHKKDVNFLDETGESSTSGKLLKTPNFNARRRRSSFVKLSANQTEMLRHRRMTRTGLSDLAEEKAVEDKPKIKMENTYKMIPDEGTVFAPCKVKREIYKTFDNYLGDMKYDPERCSKLCVDLSVLIKNNIKALEFPRYKIVCNVIIGQCKDQGLETASRSVWDEKNDNYAFAVYKNTSLFAIGIVHGVYYE